MLCAPRIAKNLLIIAQITKDNGVIVEFRYDHYHIKDKVNKEIILLQGNLKEGLYQLQVSLSTMDFTPSSLPISYHSGGFCHVVASSSISDNTRFINFVNVNNKNFDVSVNVKNKDFDLLVSFAKLWHTRLSHPQDKTLKHVMY